MNILFLEPFFGGSHREFALGLQQYSRHTITLDTLPPRFWKWRMRGAALEFARQIPNPAMYDLVVTSSLMSTSDLKALWGKTCPPILLYFHENQFTYPLSPGEKRDMHYGCTNIVSALAADAVVFNSHYHFQDFFAHLDYFAAHMPDLQPSWSGKAIKTKSIVLYPGCRFTPFTGGVAQSSRDTPLLIWNHRWEHDKNPELFFLTLENLKKKGCPFRVALLGEQFEQVPAVFQEAAAAFRGEIIHSGYVEDREEYISWLRKGTVVVSTAVQENFGIAVVEAMRFGCFPVFPDRLSYPELLPDSLKKKCLYENDGELTEKLEKALNNPAPDDVALLQNYVSRFAWENVIRHYDAVFERTVGGRE